MNFNEFFIGSEFEGEILITGQDNGETGPDPMYWCL